MSAEAVIAGYLRIAREDLNAAQLLSSQHNRNAIYHCEQAAEKIIRAILTSEGKQGEIGHQLMLMIDERSKIRLMWRSLISGSPKQPPLPQSEMS